MAFQKIANSNFSKAAIIISIIWIIVQAVLLIVYWNHPEVPDARSYCSHALQSIQHGVTYPSILDVNDQYIHAPGFVNLLAIEYLIFGTFKANYILNFLLNIGILGEIYYLGKKLFNKRVANIAVIIYCFIFSHLFVPLHSMSDHPSYFLALSGLCLSMSKKWYYVVLAGVCYAVSYTFRPTVIAFLACSVIYLIANRSKLTSYAYLILPYIIILIGIGTYNKAQTGYYINTSTLGGYGLAHAANPETASYANTSVFRNTDNTVAYIAGADTMSFAKKDSIWKARATQWIKDNPKRFISLSIPRLIRGYSADWWSLEDVVVVNDYDRAMKSSNPEQALKVRRLKQFFESIPYYLMLVFFFISLFINRRSILSTKGCLLIITALAFGYALIAIAELRFHYAFIFVMVLWASYGIDTLLAQKCRRTKYAIS